MFKKIKNLFTLQSRLNDLEKRLSDFEKKMLEVASILENLEFTEFVYEPEAEEDFFASVNKDEDKTLIN